MNKGTIITICYPHPTTLVGFSGIPRMENHQPFILPTKIHLRLSLLVKNFQTVLPGLGSTNFLSTNSWAIHPIWVFPIIGVPQNGWFIMENIIRMGGFGGTPIFGNTHIVPLSLRCSHWLFSRPHKRENHQEDPYFWNFSE